MCRGGKHLRQLFLHHSLDLELLLQISLCQAVESSLLTMSTHHYRKQFGPKLGLIGLTCARNFGPRSPNTSYFKELVSSGWFYVCRCCCLCDLLKWHKGKCVCVVVFFCSRSIFLVTPGHVTPSNFRFYLPSEHILLFTFLTNYGGSIPELGGDFSYLTC